MSLIAFRARRGLKCENAFRPNIKLAVMLLHGLDVSQVYAWRGDCSYWRMLVPFWARTWNAVGCLTTSWRTVLQILSLQKNHHWKDNFPCDPWGFSSWARKPTRGAWLCIGLPTSLPMLGCRHELSKLFANFSGGASFSIGLGEFTNPRIMNILKCLTGISTS